jgi:hypothetical protein
MRIDRLALYQKSLLGGLGGLVGWGLMSLLVRISTETWIGLTLKALFTGALVGLALGALTGAWDGIFRERSARRLLSGIRVGALLGLVGGMIGLVVGEVIFSLAGGGSLPRAIGWAVFGSLVGAHEGISKRMPQKALFGAYGGLLGGLLGGSTYESLAGMFQMVGVPRGLAVALGGAVGLVLLGMFIGLMAGLVEDLFRAAWLLFTAGRFEGQTRTLDPRKGTTTLGRSELSDICLLADPQITAQHARIVYQNGGFAVEAVDGEVNFSRGGSKFQPVQNQTLQAGDMIQLGASRARFQTGDK